MISKKKQPVSKGRIEHSPNDKEYGTRLADALRISDWLMGLPAFMEAMREFDRYQIVAGALSEKRKRGDRTKQQGAIMIEEFASVVFKARKRYLMQHGSDGLLPLNSYDATDQALRDLSLYFGVSASRLSYWIRGRAASQRRKPKAQRVHALRKRN